MANISPDLLQQAIQMLMQGRTPSPLAPVPLAPTGGMADFPDEAQRRRIADFLDEAQRRRLSAPVPLDLETTPALAALQLQPVPPALPPPPPSREETIARFTGYAPPEPVAPQPGPDPLILKIARMLQGFGAGVQGQGPQFLAQLREQRERPMREFEAKKTARGNVLRELALTGEEVFARRQEGYEREVNALLRGQYEREEGAAAVGRKFRYERALERFRTDEKIRETRAKLNDEFRLTLAKAATANPTMSDMFRQMDAEDDLIKGGLTWQEARNVVGLRAAGSPLPPGLDAKAAGAIRRLHGSIHPGRRSGTGSGSGAGAAGKLLSPENLLKNRLNAIEQRARDLANDNLIEVEDAQGNRKVIKELPGMVDRTLPTPRIRGFKSFRPLTDAEKFQLADSFRTQARSAAAADYGVGTGPKRSERPVEAKKRPAGKTIKLSQIRATAQKAGISEQEGIRRAEAAGYVVER